MPRLLDDWTIKQVLRLRWLMNMELTLPHDHPKRQEYEWERACLSVDVIRRSGPERTADVFDHVLARGGTLGIPIEVRL